MRNALVLVLTLAVMFAVVDAACGIDIPMPIRFITMYIVSMLTIDWCD